MARDGAQGVSEELGVPHRVLETRGLEKIMCILRALLILSLLTAPAGAAEKAKKPGTPPNTVVQHGKGSFYADKFHGRKTASGEKMDQNALTAASKNLPLGTRAKVTNLETGKSVNVEINDRGPYVPGRVIDLSKQAAEEVDLTKEDGIARMKVEAKASNQPTQELKEKVAEAAARNAPPPSKKRKPQP
jgi:rare lipoprotein A